MRPDCMAIREGRTCLGIELGSTRIKAVLIGEDHRVLALGSHGWENHFENGHWTYAQEEILSGLSACFADLAKSVRETYGETLARTGCIGISGMMHGYLAFDGEGKLLVPFRTWRDTTTAEAAEALSNSFQFNIPQRWSAAHLYQAILNREPHVESIRAMTTLAGYLHWRLTGEFVLGAGDASGMFPIDSRTKDFDARMLSLFDGLVAGRGFPWKLRQLLPRVLDAGQDAGRLTDAGARLLDPTGTLEAGIPFCPPEGDAGTGMVATNAVRPRTGNVSAGTSVFAMCVLERPLGHYYPEIDLVTTPDGKPVAMVHCNNCSGEIDAWIRLLGEAARALHAQFDTEALYNTLFSAALMGDADCGGLLAYNYLSGEPIAGFSEGRPLLARTPEAKLTLGNLMRAELYTAVGALHIGMELLRQRENVSLDSMTGHGGFFKVGNAGQQVMSAALGVPVTVMSTAGEGGPWGMAVLASYRMRKSADGSLADFLDARVFCGDPGSTLSAPPEMARGFRTFMERYRGGLPLEAAALEYLREEMK